MLNCKQYFFTTKLCWNKIGEKIAFNIWRVGFLNAKIKAHPDQDYETLVSCKRIGVIAEWGKKITMLHYTIDLHDQFITNCINVK